ncbi:hypothetical protein ACFQGR_00410 [Weissella sagaensis]|uniref:Uncharacterized protein n=1 Tax=Weissella sagaensis TaxID=2559928 RepID=A0ABW1RR21_9LACO|nr:hypothetical protein [Weissella sagaensis]
MGFKKAKKQKFSLKQLAELRRPQVGVLDILPFKRFEGDDNLLVLAGENKQDAGYMDMLTIYGKDLDFVYGVGSEGASNIIRDYHLLLNTFTSDFDIIITRMAAETTIQQRAWLANRQAIDQEMAQTTDQRRYRQLQLRYQLVTRQIESLRHVAENVKHQSYTAFIYGESAAETRTAREIFMSSGGRAITAQPMLLDKKKTMLQILQDPTQQLNQ